MTRFRVLLLAGLLVATASAAAPATAAVLAPEGGLTCGLHGTSSDRDRYSATITGGPYAVAEPGALVSIQCRLQVVRHPGEVETVATMQSSPSPGVGVLGPQTVQFVTTYSSGMTFEICTEVTIYEEARPPRIEAYDADHDPTNGVQCERTTSYYGPEAADVFVFVKPPSPSGPACVEVDPDVGGLNDPVGVCP